MRATTKGRQTPAYVGQSGSVRVDARQYSPSSNAAQRSRLPPATALRFSGSPTAPALSWGPSRWFAIKLLTERPNARRRDRITFERDDSGWRAERALSCRGRGLEWERKRVRVLRSG